MGARFKRTVEFFSVGQLLETFFAPFRQISANSSYDTSVPGELRAFFDKLLSRTIGAIVRLFTITFGLVVIVLQACYELVVMALWWLLPAFPIIGLILFAIGWVPQWT